MKHSTGKYLNDVLISIDRIKGYIADIEFEQYKKDDGLKDAVERRLSIIGEALFQIYRTGEELKVSYNRNIIALRHILVHDYDIVEDEVIWDIITIHLSILKKEVEIILEDNNK